MNRPGGLGTTVGRLFQYAFFIDPEHMAIGITLTQQMPGGEDINTLKTRCIGHKLPLIETQTPSCPRTLITLWSKKMRYCPLIPTRVPVNCFTLTRSTLFTLRRTLEGNCKDNVFLQCAAGIVFYFIGKVRQCPFSLSDQVYWLRGLVNICRQLVLSL